MLPHYVLYYIQGGRIMTRKFVSLFMLLCMLMGAVPTIAAPFYAMRITDTTWIKESTLGTDLNHNNVDDKLLKIDGEMFNTVPDGSKFTITSSVGTIQPFWSMMPFSQFRLYAFADDLAQLTSSTDAILTLKYTATDIDLESPLPIKWWNLSIPATVNVTSGANVTLTGTISGDLPIGNNKIVVWDANTKIATATITNNAYSVSFVARGPVGTTYQVTVQPDTVPFNGVVYTTVKITDKAQISVTTIPDTILANVNQDVRLVFMHNATIVPNANVTGTITLGNTKLQFTGTTDENGVLIVHNVNLPTNGVAHIAAEVVGALVGTAQGSFTVTTNEQYSINVVWPQQWVIGQPNQVQVVLLGQQQTVTVTVQGNVVEAGKVLHTATFNLTPLGYGTVTLVVEAGNVKRTLQTQIPGMVMQVTPTNIEHSSTTTISAQLQDKYGDYINNAIVQFVSPANGGIITEVNGRITNVNNGKYNLTISGTAIPNPDPNAYVVALYDQKVVAYQPVAVTKQHALSVKIANPDMWTGVTTTMHVIVSASTSLGDIDCYIQTASGVTVDWPHYMYHTSSTTATLDIPILWTATGNYKLVVETNTSKGSADIVVRDPQFVTTPSVLYANNTATISITSSDIDIANVTQVSATGLTLTDIRKLDNIIYCLVTTGTNTSATITLTGQGNVKWALPVIIQLPPLDIQTVTINTTDKLLEFKATVNGQPLPTGTQLTINLLGVTYTAVVEAEGVVRVSLPTPLPAGNYAFVVSSTGYGATAMPLHVVSPVLSVNVVNVTPSVVTLTTNAPIGARGILQVGTMTWQFIVGANGTTQVQVQLQQTGTIDAIVIVENYQPANVQLYIEEHEEEQPQVVIELTTNLEIYTINGQVRFWDATPFVKDGRTMVPIRALGEAIGFRFDWDFSDPANQMVFVYKKDNTSKVPDIILVIGHPIAMVNGVMVPLDTAPVLFHDRTMVPLRFVAETLGYEVQWIPPTTVRLIK